MEAIGEHLPFIVGALILGFCIKWGLEKFNSKGSNKGTDTRQG